MHTIVYDFFFIKQTSCLIQNNLMNATYVRQSSLTRNFEGKKNWCNEYNSDILLRPSKTKEWDIEPSENDRDA